MMLNRVRNIFQQAFGNGPVHRCAICAASHLDAGPFVEGPDGFLACSSCLTRLSETEPVIAKSTSTHVPDNANPYDPPNAGTRSHTCVLCGEWLPSRTLHTVDNQHFACSDCIDTSKKLLLST